MKKTSSVQGTFSKLFGKKHANNTNTTSLYATNPPWIFTQEITSDGKGCPGDVVELYYEDNRYTTVTDSGTATLKPRPRVRPLLTFIPLNAQETHGVAVPTPSVPDSFEGKTTLGLGPQMNGNYRMYSSVGDLRPKAFEREYLDDDIPPPPPVAPPPPPMAPPPPPMEIPPPPPPLPPPPPPPPMAASVVPPSLSSSTLSSPSLLSPPDFIPPAPPLEFLAPPPPPLPPPAPPLPPPLPPAPTTPLSIPNGVSKWKSEMVLNTKQTDTRGNASANSLNVTTPPASNPKEDSLTKSTPEPHLTFPRSFKVPPATPMRSSSIHTEEDSCEDSGPISRQPHTRPPLPPSFTIRPAAKVRYAGEAEQMSTLNKQMGTKPVWQSSEPANPRAGPDSSKGSNSNSSQSSLSEATKVPPFQMLEKAEKDSGPKAELPAAEEELDVPSPDYASSDEDWKEPSNLNKLKQELSALLSSSARRDERPLDKPVTPKPRDSIPDQAKNERVSSGGSNQVKATWKDPQPPAGGKSEREEKVPPSAVSANENYSEVVLTAISNKSISPQANNVKKFRNELEALLSPTKEGKPPLGLTNHRQSPGTDRVTLLHSGSSQTNFGISRLPKPVASQLPPAAAPVEAEKMQDNCETPSALTSKTLENLTPLPENRLSDNAGKSPNYPQKPKDQLVVPASPSPSSTEPVSPIQTSGPYTDFSLVQYKIHRAKSSSTDSLSSLTPSQPVEERPVTINKPGAERGILPCSAENSRVSSEPSSSSSTNAGQEDDDVLIHPVTGEKVEKGSPMALLLAARQRAQRGRLSASRQNSCTSKKPHTKLSEKFSSSSSHSETGSTNFYYSESKPYSFVVVPKSQQKESPALLEGKQHDKMEKPEGQAPGFLERGQREYKPLSFSSTSEQCRSTQKLSTGESQNLFKPERFGASSLVQGILASSHLRPQDPQPKPALPLSALSPPASSSSKKEEEENEEKLDYGIIPPPPEFSNDANRVDNNAASNRRPPNVPAYGQPSERQQDIRCPSYGNSYGLPPKTAPDTRTRNTGFSHHYPGGNYSTGLPVTGPNSRPLIKKRLYLSEPDSSYPRTSTSSRTVSTAGTYSHSMVGYSSQVAEGMRRVNSTHKNIASSVQGRRMSLEPPGKTIPYSNATATTMSKGQSGGYTAAATSRPAASSLQNSTSVNTFTVRPGTRQPISHMYQGGSYL